MIDPEDARKRRSQPDQNWEYEMNPDQFEFRSPLAREYFARMSPEWDEQTIEGAYGPAMKHFEFFIDLCIPDDEKGLLDITRGDIYQFYEHCTEDQGYRYSTVSNRKTVLKGFYQHMQLDDDYDPSVTGAEVDHMLNNRIREACAEKIEREPISRAELHKLYQNANSDRNVLLLRFLYETGGRNSCVCKMPVRNVNTDDLIVIFENSKHGKDYKVPIRPELGIRIEAWIDTGREALLNGRESEYLFPSQRSGKLTRNSLNRIVKQIAERAGIQDSLGKMMNINQSGSKEWRSLNKVTPHALRHSIITHLDDNEVDAEVRRLLAGHESVETTREYSHASHDSAFEILREEI